MTVDLKKLEASVKSKSTSISVTRLGMSSAGKSADVSGKGKATKPNTHVGSGALVERVTRAGALVASAAFKKAVAEAIAEERAKTASLVQDAVEAERAKTTSLVKQAVNKEQAKIKSLVAKAVAAEGRLWENGVGVFVDKKGVRRKRQRELHFYDPGEPDNINWELDESEGQRRERMAEFQAHE